MRLSPYMIGCMQMNKRPDVLNARQMLSCCPRTPPATRHVPGVDMTHLRIQIVQQPNVSVIIRATQSLLLLLTPLHQLHPVDSPCRSEPQAARQYNSDREWALRPHLVGQSVVCPCSNKQVLAFYTRSSDCSTQCTVTQPQVLNRRQHGALIHQVTLHLCPNPGFTTYDLHCSLPADAARTTHHFYTPHMNAGPALKALPFSTECSESAAILQIAHQQSG